MVALSAEPAPILQKAVEVRALTVEQAEQGAPVRLRGVVTFFDEALYSHFIQDETAGIYVRTSGEPPGLEPGQWVEIEGVTSPGEYAPVVVLERARVLGETNFPPARQVTFEQLASGKEDSQFVEVEGIVRSVQFEEASRHHVIEMAVGGGRLSVYARELPVPSTADLVDSTIRVRGVCSTVFNRQRQLFAIRLLAPRRDDLVVKKAHQGDPFQVPTQGLGSLLQFAPQGTYGHRVKVRGAVTLQQPGEAIYIADDKYGLRVETRQQTPLAPGDVVEVLGFVEQGGYTPILQDADFRKVGSGRALAPDAITHDEALRGGHDCRLVRLEAKLLDRARHSREHFLVLESGSFIFHAYQAAADSADPFAGLENGSRVAVTGVCLVEPGRWEAGESWRAKSFRLLLRSPADVVVLRSPPWWTLRKVLWMAGGLVLVSLAAFAWVAVLRRRVYQQTGIIRERLQTEASLKERYEDLFENANDMVFTHDLRGQITSINKTGERLLQRPRQEILAHNILDLVAEDQRGAARHWLDQVVQGADLPTAEWDFLNAAGQRVKLELSSRLVEQNGRGVEVEGIARDVTERRRLERELLEISNREQRRIGHDLHDGICQQLAAIGYMLDIMGDKLAQKGSPEAAEAEKIGGLINEATLQARSVSRGLFPVRLAEKGLVSSLEEFAASTSRGYKIDCRFLCPQPPSAVDNELALHLYYIAQEATMNAVRHGNAAHVTISLVPEAGRFVLRVEDDGTGFSPAAARAPGMGIRIMRYRAKVIGATLDVKSQPGRGTQVSCTFLPDGRETIRETANA